MRYNSGNLVEMKKAIHATLFHVASSVTNNWHNPTGKGSWCRYQSDKATGLNKYKTGPGLPMEVIKHVKPIYFDLSKG